VTTRSGLVFKLISEKYFTKLDYATTVPQHGNMPCNKRI